MGYPTVWSDASALNTSWGNASTLIWSRYDSGDYDGLLLAEDDVDLTYDGGYMDIEMWTNQSVSSNTWSNQT